MLVVLAPKCLWARKHIIYSMYEEVPMTNDAPKAEKFYYVNMGKKQGLKKGAILEVIRHMDTNNPYERDKRYTIKAVVGKLVVHHVDEENAVALEIKDKQEKAPSKEKELGFLENPYIQIGDLIEVAINPKLK